MSPASATSVKSDRAVVHLVLESVSYGSPHDAVFVHGAGGNNLLWRRTLEGLSGSARAFAVNLPGHPQGEIICHTIDDYSEALHTYLQEGGLVRPVVCGHSMGGAVAMRLAISHPDAVGGLILVSTGARLGVSTEILEGLRDGPMRAIENVITPWSFNSIDLGLAREARAALSISNLPVFLNDYLACEGFDVRNDLPRISAPTLVVCGDKDRMTPPKWSHYLGSNIPGAELIFIKDSGHMIPLERPDSLAGVVQSFLTRITR